MGSKGCPCINASDTLASLSDRHCNLPNGETGIQLTLAGNGCVPFTYGSSQCLQHDLLNDPLCDIDKAGERIIEAYCVRPFCYVDVAACIRESKERVYRSSYFPHDSGVDIFYSYSTCNSTADDWFAVEDQRVDGQPYDGVSINAVVPTYVYPMMFKRNSSGHIQFTPGSELYEHSIPYEGIYIDHVKRIQEISRGDIENITFAHRSQVSSIVHPESSFTAAVQDIEDGIFDMAIGPFWITASRLTMASFTIPLVYDKTLLVVPRNGTKETLSDQVQKVLAPLSPELWGLLVGFIIVAALLSVWFSDRSEEAMNQNNGRMGLQRNGPKKRRRKRAYARLALDSCLQKGLFFFSAGVEQDESASLPNKLLLFGFGFFILIAVSAYVANLAAFLTLSTNNSVKSMDAAVAAGMTICAHPAVKVELELAWPDAKFYFTKKADFPGMLEDFDAGICPVMAVGYEDTILDTAYLAMLCERELVYSDSVVAEIPIAFPIRPDLASGFSYWMYKGERSGVTLQNSKDGFPREKSCNVFFSKEDAEASEYEEISIKNMYLPILFFVTCSVLAIILQIIHMCQVRRGKDSLVGTRSTLSLVTDSNRKSGTRPSWKLSLKNDFDPEEEEKEEEKEDSFDEGVQSFDHFDENGFNEGIMSTKSLMTGSLNEAGSLHLGGEAHRTTRNVTFLEGNL